MKNNNKNIPSFFIFMLNPTYLFLFILYISCYMYVCTVGTQSSWNPQQISCVFVLT